jgi:STE24 endopeptidase
MEHPLLILIVLILVSDFLLDRLMDYLNAQRWSPVLPEALHGITDAETYRRSQEYARRNRRLRALSAGLSFLLVLALLLSGGFGWLDAWVRQHTVQPVLQAILFFGILGLASDLLSTPFQVYATFVIEESFGFNRTSPATFLADKFKGWLLALLIGGALLALFVWFYQVAGPLFWLYAWIAFTGFSLFMSLFYSSLIVPLFNRQTPLEEGELRTAIQEFADKTGFRLADIYVIDGSKRSTKANAYFSGLGPKKRIVLFDTLIRDHSTEELVAILAHEIGHYKHKHLLRGMLLSIAQGGILFFLLGMVINRPGLSLALGGTEQSFHLGLLGFALLYAPLSLVLGMAANYLSRKYEYQADAFAARHHAPGPLMEALKKLSVKHLSNLHPHPAYVFLHYSHPPLLQRLEHLSRFFLTGPGPVAGRLEDLRQTAGRDANPPNDIPLP